MDGTDLMPIYDDPTVDIHETIALINVWGNPATHALAVVTKDMKYIHWPYAAEGFEATDELYHLSKDPHELVNQADNPEFAAAIKQMRQRYDGQLTNWSNEAVSYNKYKSYSTAFDRNIVWADKSDAFSKIESKPDKKKQN
jgi:arylsulfatase A-like enzyme